MFTTFLVLVHSAKGCYRHLQKFTAVPGYVQGPVLTFRNKLSLFFSFLGWDETESTWYVGH
jgi:hypothetical protein